SLPQRPAVTLGPPEAPVCGRDIDPPAELGELLEVLREVPIAWLPDLAGLAERFARKDALEAVFEAAGVRAKTKTDVALGSVPAAGAFGLAAPMGAQVATRLAAAYRGSGLALAKAKSGLGAGAIAGLGLRAAKERAQKELSLAD